MNSPLNDELEKKKDARDANGALYREYALASVSGLEIGVGVALGAILGYLVDDYFATAPYGITIGLGLGVIHSVRAFYRTWKRTIASFDDDESKPS